LTKQSCENASAYPFRYSVTITTEALGTRAPVLLRGEMRQTVRTAKELGYDAVELHLRDAARFDGAALYECCLQNNIKVSALATGLDASLNHLSMVDADAAARAKTLQNLKDHIDLAEKTGAIVIIGLIRGNLGQNPSDAMRYFEEQLHILARYAADRGVVIALEAINSYLNDYLNTVKETCDFIRAFGANNLVLHIDTHHMNMEDYNPVEAIHYAGETIGYVHFAEINRMYPGAGSMDFPAFMRALKDVGYKGYISMECVPIPDALTASRKSIEYLKSCI
jgi:sugar phosphate isomerase/epimerase